MTVRVDHEGVWITINGKYEGLTFLLPAELSIAAIQNHLAELTDFYEGI